MTTAKIHATRLMATLLVLLMSAPMVQAQDDGGDMDFTVGDGEGGEGGEGGDDSSMDFSLDEAEKALPGEGLALTGLIMPSDPSVPTDLTDLLTATLMQELDKLEGYQNLPNDGVRDQFAALGGQGAQDCLYDAICLSAMGRELGMARMVVGRLSGSSGDYSLSIDLINVEEGTVIEYVSRTVKGDERELNESVAKVIPRLFGLRLGGGGGSKEPVGPEGPGPVQTALAWTTLGVGVVSVGVGVFFGLEASSLQDDLENGARVSGSGAFAITQVEAQKQVEDAESNALLANVFYGVGLVAGVTSALLFLITPGSDIATEEELSSGGGFKLSPMVGPEATGVSAGFTW